MKFSGKFRAIAGVLCTFMCCSVPVPSLAVARDDGKTEISTWNQIEGELKKETKNLDDSDYEGYIVKLKDDTVFLMNEDTDGIERINRADGLYLADDLDAAQEFADAEDIEYVEPNYVVQMYDDEFDNEIKDVTTNVSGDENDKHLALMNVDKVRDEYGIKGEDYDTDYDMGNDGNPQDKIVVAVIDSGLDPDHDDIDYSHVLEGKSFVNTTTTTDTMGHGTFVTGEIIANTSNSIGINGIAEDVYVMPLKVFSSRSTTNAIIINALNYAADQRRLFDSSNGAEGSNITVINMSLGSESASTALKEAVDDAIEAGIIVLCAAGNDEDSRASYPAQYGIGVGSTNSEGERSYYSQILSEMNGDGWENKVWVTGPGEKYTSLWYTGEYYYGSGTSFSTPQVAALAAVAVSLKNDLTSHYAGKNDDDGNPITNNHYAFRQLLKDTSKRMDNGLDKASNGQDTYYGWGMVDFKAVADTLINFGENQGKVGKISFKADNGAGTELTAEKNNLAVEVRAYEDSDTLSDIIQPDENGIYSLEIGKKYKYTVTADKYTAIARDMRVVIPSRTVYVTMEGLDYHTSFDIKDTAGQTIPNADITVKRASGSTIIQQDDGSFLTKNGRYTYTISVAGYFPVAGSFTVNDEENEYPDLKNKIAVTLRSAADICSVTFDVTGTGDEPYAEVTLMDSQGEKVEPYGDGAWKLEPGSYSYEIDSEYYVAVTGEFIVEEADKGTERVIKETMTRPLYWAFIDVMPLSVFEAEGTTIVVRKLETDSEGNFIEKEKVEPYNGALGEYRIENGDYSYTVKANGYKSDKGTFKVESAILYVDVLLEEGTDSPDDGTGGGDSGGSGDSGDTGSDSGSSDGSGSGSGSSGGTSGGSGSGTGGTSGGSGSGSGSGSGTSGGTSTNVGNKDDKNDTDKDAEAEHEYENIEIKYHDFEDVLSGDWYYEPVNFVTTVGLFNGLSDKIFGTDKAMTRGMLTTVLYRLSGEDKSLEGKDMTDEQNISDKTKASGEQKASEEQKASDNQNEKLTKFEDVPEDAYYADAVAWAYSEGIVKGKDEKHFDPNGYVTREQIAVMLYNYTSKHDKDVTVHGDGAVQAFKDYSSVASYAESAVSWAYENSIIKGDGKGNFRAKDSATRAEVASLMTNLLRNVF